MKNNESNARKRGKMKLRYASRRKCALEVMMLLKQGSLSTVATFTPNQNLAESLWPFYIIEAISPINRVYCVVLEQIYAFSIVEWPPRLKCDFGLGKFAGGG